MKINNICIGDIICPNSPIRNNHNIYGKVIAIFSDGLLFFETLDSCEEYKEVFSHDIEQVPISEESLLDVGFVLTGDNLFEKQSINNKYKVVISENGSYIEILNSNSRTPLEFSLYSLLNTNTLHILQRAARDIGNDDLI